MNSLPPKKRSRSLDLTGRKFERLTVIGLIRVAESGNRKRWQCLCDCGKLANVQAFQLTSGRTRSCGCIRKEMLSARNFSHGKTSSKAYVTWSGIIQRCTNPNNQKYYRYGARGITVCDRWLKFENFYEDMGDCPEGMTIDRINNDLGYYLENCRWATPAQQMRNYSRTHLIEFQGKIQCLTDWASEMGMPRHVLTCRLLRDGWSIERALTTPVKRLKRG